MEERPVLGTTLEDLDELRLRKYFRRRFPDWMCPDDWSPTLIAHALALEDEERVVPTCLGIVLFAEQPERFLPGAYVDVALYTHDEANWNTADSQRFFGPLPEQIERTVLHGTNRSPLIYM